MTDPSEIIRTGLTAAKLGAAAGASIPFTALARRTLGPAADEVAEMLRDSIRLYRYNRQLKLLHKAQAMASKAGFTPDVVSLKILFPLLEGASLEEDDDIHTMWAALLANASNPEATELVLPSFGEVFRILTPNEAKLLDAAYKLSLLFYPVINQSRQFLGVAFQFPSAALILAGDATPFPRFWLKHAALLSQTQVVGERWTLHEGRFQVNIAMVASVSINLVLTDLPYNIGLRDSSASHSAGLGGFSDHNLDITSLLVEVAVESYRMLRNNRFAVFFYGMNNHEELYDALTVSGFSADVYPFIWLRDKQRR